jgi:filamentous hemagglutinin
MGLYNLANGQIVYSTSPDGQTPSESRNDNVTPLKYTPTKKHQKGGHGTEMDLNDKTASEVLNKSIKEGKQRYGVNGEKVYKFQPDNVGGWHGYPVDGKEVPAKVVRELFKNGQISKPLYNRLIKSK